MKGLFRWLADALRREILYSQLTDNQAYWNTFFFGHPLGPDRPLTPEQERLVEVRRLHGRLFQAAEVQSRDLGRPVRIDCGEDGVILLRPLCMSRDIEPVDFDPNYKKTGKWVYG